MLPNAPRALLFGLAMVAVTGVVMVGLRGQYPVWMARYWQSRLDEASDDQVPMLLASIARLEEPGIPVLVEACGSERESVARAAWDRLTEELARWELLSPPEASRRLAVLADSLARHAPRFGPTARVNAARLATRILLWPLDPTAVDRGLVVASCEQVLQATAPDRVLLAQRRRSRGVTHLALGGDRQPADGDSSDRPTIAAGLKPKRSPLEPNAILRLPHASADGIAPLPSVEIGIAGSSGLGDPPARGLRQPERLTPGASARSFSNRGVSIPRPTPSESSAKMGNPWHPPDGFAAPDPLENALERIETVPLMRRLHDSDPRMVMRAETELARRGFSVSRMELARQLFHPDVKVRKQLAQNLPGTIGVNAVPWLMQLSRDRDPQVRMTAITLMATTGEPSLLDEIERIASRDPSPRVRLQAKRVAELRQARTY